MSFYLIPAAVVFSKTLHAFWEDETTPKTHVVSWFMIVLASMLWPLTLPSILYKQHTDSLSNLAPLEEESDACFGSKKPI
jgi:hypothetical protein